MKHLTEEQLMRLVLDRSTLEAGEQRHLRRCSECGARHEELRQLAACLCESWAVPPVSAWSRLRRRMERSRRPGRDWTEPRWLPLVAVHFSAVAITLGLILALGSWLGSSALWGRIGTLGVVGAIGPRGLVGLAFAVVGGLGVLAMMPILWWESRIRS